MGIGKFDWRPLLFVPIRRFGNRATDDSCRLDCGVADLGQIRPSGVVRRSFGKDELDESENDRQMIAERVQRRTVQLW